MGRNGEGTRMRHAACGGLPMNLWFGGVRHLPRDVPRVTDSEYFN